MATAPGYSAEIIIQKTGLSPKYVKDIVFLLDQGEERLIEGVQRGAIPLTTALEIARANENATEGDGQANLGSKASAEDSGLRTKRFKTTGSATQSSGLSDWPYSKT